MKIPESAEELFSMLAEAISHNADEARKINATYLFNITGSGGGSWVVDLTSEDPSCKPGTIKRPDSTIEVSHEDFQKMLATPAIGMELYFQGKLRVIGDPGAATRLHSVFSLIQ